MCIKCMHDPRPDRGRFCVESGAYMLNFKGCAACAVYGPLSSQRAEAEDADDDEDDAEETAYTHHCAACGHQVAAHWHRWEVTREGQEYTMDCVLCGHGADVVKHYAEDDVAVTAGGSAGPQNIADGAAGALGADAEAPKIVVGDMSAAVSRISAATKWKETSAAAAADGADDWDDS